MTHQIPGERWYRRLLHLYPRDFRDEFGGEMTRLYRDRGRKERWWSLWGSLLLDLIRTAPSEHLAMLKQDCRHAWRGLRRTPVITATAILTLALGVGASTAVFSVVHAVLLRPLPYPAAHDLVELFEEDRRSPAGAGLFRASALNYLSWVARAQSFDAIAAFGSAGMTLTDGGDPEMLPGSFVTPSLFQVLRVSPIAGRTLQPEDGVRAGSRVVVLGESLWRSRFGGDAGIVGRSITLDGERYQVVGVMPQTFREVGRAQAAGAAGAQIFLPMAIDPARENRGNHTLRVVGRLRRGVALEQARDDMRAVSGRLEQEFPATNTNWGVRVERLSDTTLEPRVRRSLLLVLGAVTLVFLIACANVANLMLARETQRRAEFAVRTALGAGRPRLVRQLLTESSCLAVVSGAAGVFAAAVAFPLVRTLLPATVPRVDEMQLDMNVLAFGLLITSVSGAVFGVVPAVRASRLGFSQPLMLTGRATADISRVRLRQSVIAGQVAVATMLLVGAALLLQGFVRLQGVPLGFEANDVLTARLSLPRSRYADADRAGEFYQRLVETLQASGQLRTVAVATSAPFATGVRAAFRAAPELPDVASPRDATNQRWLVGPQVAGRPGGIPPRTQASPPAAGPQVAEEFAAEHIVSAGFFRVLGIPLLAGRAFDERDTTGAARVAIVSQRLARRLWPDTNPLGQTVERSGGSYEIIGVVGDVRGSDTQGLTGGGPDRDPRPAVYFAAGQLPQRTMTLLVRPSGDSAGVIAGVRDAVRQLDPTLALQQVRPLQDWLAAALAPIRLATRLATVFAVSALLLASVGIYGVLAFTVASRTREIGVHMAMGATRRRVLGLVLQQGMTCAGSGVLLGLVGAFAAARLIATLLFDVPARDPLTFAAVGGAVTLVALLASTIPALRAVRIDPTIAMRAE
jgi:putative ABC transport system permease protein